MANTKVSQNGKELAIIDSAPEAAGYWTNPVNFRRLRDQSIYKLFFSASHKTSTPSTAVPTLQFRLAESDAGEWTDYNNDGSAFVVGDNKLIENNAVGIQWRAGVKNGDFGGGPVIVGFNW